MILRSEKHSPRDTDARRTARLQLDAELSAGRISEEDAAAPAVLRGLSLHSLPSRPVRVGQRLAMKAGRVDGVDAMLKPAIAVRQAALGSSAAGPPRFLVRVDEFPHAGAFDDPARYGMQASVRFHDVMASAGVSYLMAVVPQLTRAHLDPTERGGRELDRSEVDFLQRLRTDGIAIGQHGATHRTRYAKPRLRSELGGLDDVALAELLDSGRERLERIGVSPRVFVPPFNRFDARQWPALSARYSVVTGGPESVSLLGLRPATSWHGDAVFVPCYEPLYAKAVAALPAVERVLVLAPGTWVPVVLHLGWEADDGFHGLSRLASRIAPYAASWDHFLTAVDRSAVESSPPPA